jgi:adenosine 3'-phospho 5'-phosphosulfate transporter B3
MNNNSLGGVLSAKLDSLPRPFQFVTLALCVFFFFGIHNVLQEAMLNTDGFHFGVMLGWMEVLGVTLCSGIERSNLPLVGNGEGRRPRQAPLVAYPPLTICLLLSSSLASWSLNYINFPTKVVFRSCKLLPTMILAVVMGNAKRFSLVEVGSAVAVCAGLITFAAGDWSLSKPQFHPFGLTLVSLSVFADAILPNAQERLFRTYDASKSEVMFYTNVFTFMIQTGSAILSGDLMGMFHFIMGQSSAGGQDRGILAAFRKDHMNSTVNKEILLNEDLMHNQQTSDRIRYTFLTYVIAYILISHIAVSAHTAVVKKFGGVAAVFVGTARKGMTLVLSVRQLHICLVSFP